MKSKITIILLFLFVMSFTGCSKYEKDNSKNANLYGTYSQTTEATNTAYNSSTSYILSDDNTYKFTATETINGKNTKDYSKDGQIISVEHISDDVTQITLDKEVLFKYKNMIGELYKVSIPDSKTFELKSSDMNFWFDDEGQYHLCSKLSECDCVNSCPQYKRNKDIIYFQSLDEAHKNIYTIAFYIVDDGLFAPKLYKTSE